MLTGSLLFGGALTASVLAGTSSASALPPVTATGSLVCRAGSGSVKYAPAWKDSTSSAITATINFKLTDCSGGSENPATVKGSGRVTFTPVGVDQCTADEDNGGTGSIALSYVRVHGQPPINPSTYTGTIWPGPDTEGGSPFFWAPHGSVSGSFAVDADVPPYSYAQILIDDAGQRGSCTTGVHKIILGGTTTSSI